MRLVAFYLACVYLPLTSIISTEFIPMCPALRTIPLVLAFAGVAVFANVASAQEAPAPRFDGSWEALQKMPVPAWFDDGKIGIFIHWGPYSTIAYRKGGRGYSEHVTKLIYRDPEHYFPLVKERWGAHPPEFGYKDIIPMFKAEKWDPDQWAELFEEVGAKYVCLLYTSPSPRDRQKSRMPSSA